MEAVNSEFTDTAVSVILSAVDGLRTGSVNSGFTDLSTVIDLETVNSEFTDSVIWSTVEHFISPFTASPCIALVEVMLAEDSEPSF